MLRLLFASIVFLIILLLILAGTFFLYMILMPQLPHDEQIVTVPLDPEDYKAQLWQKFCDEYHSLPSQTYLSYLKLLSSYPSILHGPFADSLARWSKIRQHQSVL